MYVIQGYSGQVDQWLARTAFEPTIVERLDAMFAAGECPDAIVVFVDAWTSLGGSQFLNSTSTGRYMDYLCDEVVAFVDERYPTLADREHRGLAGKSSGGYGAMVVPMLRPDVFGALASHAGDALFECCYLRDFPVIARELRDHFDGSYKVLRERLAGGDRFDWSRYGTAFSMYAYAAAYTPDPERPGEALLPFDVATGRLLDDVWARWLELDPVRMAPRYAGALASMRRIYLDAGKSDEFFLDLGAQAFSAELRTARRAAHARAVRRQARRDLISVSGRDPRARARARRALTTAVDRLAARSAVRVAVGVGGLRSYTCDGNLRRAARVCRARGDGQARASARGDAARARRAGPEANRGARSTPECVPRDDRRAGAGRGRGDD